MRRVPILIATLAVAGAAAVAAEAPSGPQPLPAPLVAAPGRVEPLSEEIRVSTAATGVLASVSVEEGARVAAGAVLATVDNAEETARLAAAEAAVAVERATLDRLVNGAAPEERREALALVREAEAMRSAARKEVERQRALLAKGVASPQVVEKAEREHEVAEARVAAARAHHAVVDRPARADDLARARAAIALAEAQRDAARALLDKTLVRSPVDGVVLSVLRRPGELVTVMRETAIAIVGDVTRLRVRAQIDEADVARLALGQPAWVRATAFGATRFPGTVVRIGGRMGAKTTLTERPDEKMDRKVLDVLIELAGTPPLPVGLRVDVFIAPPPG